MYPKTKCNATFVRYSNVVHSYDIYINSGQMLRCTGSSGRSYLHASVPDVVVVLHAAGERVPRRPVCRSVPEARGTHLVNYDHLMNDEFMN